MQTAVVILNWNGRALLEEFLPSVWEFSKDQATIYVADNASTDDSLAYLTNHFPGVKCIKNTKNLGYAGGYNESLTQVDQELLVLLNSDVKVTKDWLVPIQTAFKNKPEMAAAQPKILSYKQPNYFEYAGAAGGFLDKYAYPYCRGRIFDTLEQDTGQYNQSTPIFWATGACLCIRNSEFKNLGGFDSDFFAHMEEIDLCWRLQNKGRQIWYLPQSQVYHLGGGTLANTNPQKTYYNFRNSLYCLAKNVAGFTAYKRIFLRMCLDGIAGVRFITQGKPKHCWAILRAHTSLYRNFSTFRKKQLIDSQNTTYFTISSIVYKYFVGKRKTFDKL